MKTQADSSDEVCEQAVKWMEACRNTARKMTAALIQTDLMNLEESLEEEKNLIVEHARLLAAMKPFDLERNPVSSMASVLRPLTSLAAEIRSLNQRNSALVRTGLDFSRILLSVLRPPLTYGETPRSHSTNSGSPVEEIFSVEG